MPSDAAVVKDAWTPASWRSKPAAQQPDWPDEAHLERVQKTLASEAPLVFPGECRALSEHLAKVARGEAFLLQAGDCAESMDAFAAEVVRDKLKIKIGRAHV